MKICMISDYSGVLDEGVRNTAFYLLRELSKSHKVLHTQVLDLFRRKGWRKIKDFQADILHFIPGPTAKCFMLTKALQIYGGFRRTVISATHPAVSRLLWGFIPILKPDLLLVQSYDSEIMFKKWGCRTEFLPSGVDTDKFSPPSEKKRRKLRAKYQIDQDKTVLLHVGSIKRSRNLRLLVELQKKLNVQSVVIGSESIPMERDLMEELVEAGCIVLRSYLPNIEEIYALSDYYIFPTISEPDAIEMPLSVMEAMSCNLPVISTRFRGLPRIFKEGDGFFYASNENDFLRILQATMKTALTVKTREKVLNYSWGKVASKLEDMYQELLQ